MKGLTRTFKSITRWAVAVLACSICLITITQTTSVEAAEGLGGPPHIGTFEGSTTFTTSSSNGINPGLYLEVMDSAGNYTEYTSEEGVITIQGTKEGAYVTQAKLLGKTKYVDQATGEILDQWEAGRDLTLVSSENPGLMTIGKNLLNPNTYEERDCSIRDIVGLDIRSIKGHTSAARHLTILKVKPSTTYTIGLDETSDVFQVFIGYANQDYIGTKNVITWSQLLNNKATTFTTDSDTHYLFLNFHSGDYNVQLEESPSATSYEPYQSNRLTVNKEVELRGIGDVRDELDLLTGKVTEHIGEVVFDGRDDFEWQESGYSGNGYYAWFTRSVKDAKNVFQSVNCDKLPQTTTINQVASDNEGCVQNTDSQGWGNILIKLHNKGATKSDLKLYLSQNPITVQYELASPATNALTLNSTYYFEPVLNREIIVNGTILPLVASVNIPTEPLSFIIDPNQADDQQFVAPDFRITNNTPTWIALELNAFEQTTQVLKDVLPEAHDNWRQLDRAQSKDIALALVPQPSEGWLSLDEGPRYVADDSNYYLGKVKEESTVEFTFSALHGRAFIESLAPQYRLSFVFGFNEK